MKKKDIFLLLFLAIAGISLFATSSLGISAFRLVKLIEFVLLYIYVCSNPKSQIPNPKLLRVVFYSGVLQAVLAVAQFVRQGSIGIKFIEAGIFSPDSPGVANFVLNGEKIMRSYGSFPHPNVLAAFLLLAIFCFYSIFLRREIQGDSKGIKGVSFIVSWFLVVVFGLFLTFSRTAIAVFGAMSLLFFLIKFFQTRDKRIMKLFGLFVIACVLAIAILFPYIKARFFTISLQEQAVDLRFFYNRIALSMIKEKPILGIGIGNFVNYSHNYLAYLKAAQKMLNIGEPKGNQREIKVIPDWIFQPEHNVYLLIASEIGIFGLLAFLGFLVMVTTKGMQGEIKGNSKGIDGNQGGIFLFLIFCFLIIALADHYFWTLQQGGIMFWLALALASPRSSTDRT